MNPLLALASAAAAASLPTPAHSLDTILDAGWEAPAAPRLLALDGKRLLAAKAALAIGEPTVTQALGYILEDADGWLEVGPWSVTSKNATGPSGDIHDFVSQMPYFWPSEGSPDGCPYVIRDGEYNPEAQQYSTDDDGMKQAFESSYALSLAWYYTGEEKYSKHASLILKTWFLDEKTKMDPNMNYGSLLPCVEPEDNPYIFTGLISASSRITFVLEAARLLEVTEAPGWTHNDTTELQKWCSDLLRWLTTTEQGKITLGGFNNHGVYAHLAGIALGLYAGNKGMTYELLNNVTLRIDDGIAANGSQPHELVRTQPFHYSMFTLVGFTHIISLAERLCSGPDLWNYIGPDGQSIQKAIEFLIPPALNGKDAWPYEDDIHFERAAANDIFHFAADRGSEKALNALNSCKLPKPSLGDRYYVKPLPQELDAASAVRPSE